MVVLWAWLSFGPNELLGSLVFWAWWSFGSGGLIYWWSFALVILSGL